MYGSFFTGFNTTASYVWIYWICVAALNLIALLMCPFHYKYCSHMDGLLQYCLQCLLLKHSCGLQVVNVGQKKIASVHAWRSNFIWLLCIFLVSTPPLLCFLIYSCVYWSNESLQIHVLVDSPFMGKSNFWYILPCLNFIGLFFIMHVLPCKSKFDLFTALLRLDYEASYGWLAFVLHIDSIIFTWLAIENNSCRPLKSDFLISLMGCHRVQMI